MRLALRLGMDDQTAADRSLTWAGLLARWTEFAQASVALPDDEAGGQWKAAVPAIIELQAITHALSELDALADADRPAALDRAELTCQSAAKSLYTIWFSEPPTEIEEIIDDARAMFEAASNAGIEWTVASDRLVGDHAAGLFAAVSPLGFRGDVFVPVPGYPLLRDSPAAFARGPAGAVPKQAVVKAIGRFLTKLGGKIAGPERSASPRQVYRRHDFATGKLRPDLVVSMAEPPVAGQPLLVLAIEGGRLLSPALPTRGMAGAEAAEPPGIEFAQPMAERQTTAEHQEGSDNRASG